jgi:hypothetical protein
MDAKIQKELEDFLFDDENFYYDFETFLQEFINDNYENIKKETTNEEILKMMPEFLTLSKPLVYKAPCLSSIVEDQFNNDDDYMFEDLELKITEEKIAEGQKLLDEWAKTIDLNFRVIDETRAIKVADHLTQKDFDEMREEVDNGN